MQIDFNFFFTPDIELHCVYVPHFHYLSSVEGHLGCLYFLVIMMNVMNIAEQISVKQDIESFRNIPGSEYNVVRFQYYSNNNKNSTVMAIIIVA